MTTTPNRIQDTDILISQKSMFPSPSPVIITDFFNCGCPWPVSSYKWMMQNTVIVSGLHFITCSDSFDVLLLYQFTL